MSTTETREKPRSSGGDAVSELREIKTIVAQLSRTVQMQQESEWSKRPSRVIAIGVMVGSFVTVLLVVAGSVLLSGVGSLFR